MVDSSMSSPRRRLILNVSGTMFETWSDTLERFPTTLLGNENKLCLYFCPEMQEYFFNRNRLAFEAILFFYQSSGKLIKPQNISMEVFENECAFYELPDWVIDNMKQKEGIIYRDYDVTPHQYPDDLRGKLWQCFDNPQSSNRAFACNAVSAAVLAVWIAVFCAQTVLFRDRNKSYDSWWFYADMAFSSIFTLEYFLRILAAPNYRMFIRDFLKVIDLAGSIPYLILLSINETRGLAIMNFLRLLRLLRLIRVLKLFSSSDRVKMLKSIMASSINDLGLLFLCLIMVVLIGASILYFVEMDTKGTQFTSVPESAWWAIQTVVVLGYGDIIPKSEMGKLFAAFFMIFGALTISLPVLSVVTKLVKIYGR